MAVFVPAPSRTRAAGPRSPRRGHPAQPVEPLCLPRSTDAFAAEPALRIEGIVGRDCIPKPARLVSLADLHAMPRVKLEAKTHDGSQQVFEGVAARLEFPAIVYISWGAGAIGRR